MQIHLNPSDGVPIYLQIAQQVRYLIASGRLAPGEEVPPIRALAERLVVNPNTVARAYRELEHEGLLSKRSTTGTFVSSSAGVEGHRRCLARLQGPVEALVRAARDERLGLDDLLELVRQRYRAASAAAAGEATP